MSSVPPTYSQLKENLDAKINRIFPCESVQKNPDIYSVFAGHNLPSYIKDWMVKCFTNDESFDRDSCFGFISEKIPDRRQGLRRRLLHSGAPIQIFSRLIIQTDLLHGKMGFSIPDLGIGHREGVVSLNMAQHKIDRLHEGETWGILTLKYRHPTTSMNGYVELTDFKPFEPYRVDLEYYRKARRMFSLTEWIDVLIRSMEINPDYRPHEKDSHFSIGKKLILLSRLLVHVEPNLNMIELAPKGTGKSYTFTNLSKYGWTLSGGIVTRAGMFYNLSTKTPGIIHNYDFLALDEVETIQFSNDEDVLGAFKNYLENGKIVVGNYKNTSDCGLMLLGNIALDKKLQPKNSDYFLHLPRFFHSSALVDRIHGFIPGWVLFRFTEDLKLRGYALNTEYFSEILHQLRTQPIYGELVQDALSIPKNADTRDTRAVLKICTGYLKLLYPHATNLQEIPYSEFKQYVLEPALRCRAIIRQQLSVLDSEFHSLMPEIETSISYRKMWE